MLKKIATWVWRCGAKRLGARLMSYALDREFTKIIRDIYSHKEVKL